MDSISYAPQAGTPRAKHADEGSRVGTLLLASPRSRHQQAFLPDFGTPVSMHSPPWTQPQGRRNVYAGDRISDDDFVGEYEMPDNSKSDSASNCAVYGCSKSGANNKERTLGHIQYRSAARQIPAESVEQPLGDETRFQQSGADNPSVLSLAKSRKIQLRRTSLPGTGNLNNWSGENFICQGVMSPLNVNYGKNQKQATALQSRESDSSVCDEISIFTEQKDARTARYALEELFFSNNKDLSGRLPSEMNAEPVEEKKGPQSTQNTKSARNVRDENWNRDLIDKRICMRQGAIAEEDEERYTEDGSIGDQSNNSRSTFAAEVARFKKKVELDKRRKVETKILGENGLAHEGYESNHLHSHSIDHYRCGQQPQHAWKHENGNFDSTYRPRNVGENVCDVLPMPRLDFIPQSCGDNFGYEQSLDSVDRQLNDTYQNNAPGHEASSQAFHDYNLHYLITCLDDTRDRNTHLVAEIAILRKNLADSEAKASRVSALEALLQDARERNQAMETSTLAENAASVTGLKHQLELSTTKAESLEHAVLLLDRSVKDIQTDLLDSRKVAGHDWKPSEKALLDMSEKLKDLESTVNRSKELEHMLSDSKSAIVKLEFDKMRFEEDMHRKSEDYNRKLLEQSSEVAKERLENEKKIKMLQNEKERMREELKLSATKQEKENMEHIIESHAKALRDSQSTVEEQEIRLRSRDTTIRRVEQTLASRDSELRKHQTEITELKDHMSKDREESIILATETFREENKALKKKLNLAMKEGSKKELQGKLSELKEIVVVRDEVINKLTAELNALSGQDSVSQGDVERLGNENMINFGQQEKFERMTIKMMSCENQIRSQMKQIARLKSDLESSEHAKQILKEDLMFAETHGAKLSESAQESIEHQLEHSMQVRNELEAKVKNQDELLAKAGRIIAKSNAATLSSVRSSLGDKADPNTVQNLLKSLGIGSPGA